MRITSTSPILQVNDIQKSIDYYSSVLGFTEEFAYGKPAYYAGVRKDDTVLHLSSSKESSHRIGMSSLFIYCDDVTSYYDTLISQNVEVTSGLKSHPYGITDFQIADIDGNLLCFATPA